MTPEQKARDLFDKAEGYSINIFSQESQPWKQKELAILFCNEIIPSTWKLSTYKKWGLIDVDEVTTTEYWEQVKLEIQSI